MEGLYSQLKIVKDKSQKNLLLKVYMYSVSTIAIES